ncbi:hypothetical protein KCP71_14335 [Salmonella enterica subsp. enterica]|nr:hypothetical protein KCP71_14335 [Salmonella enterica subsp. enterica]
MFKPSGLRTPAPPFEAWWLGVGEIVTRIASVPPGGQYSGRIAAATDFFGAVFPPKLYRRNFIVVPT